ncbi:MAG: hypothetical protein ACYCSO_01650 [Cuniculiplasma sp.]
MINPGADSRIQKTNFNALFILNTVLFPIFFLLFFLTSLLFINSKGVSLNFSSLGSIETLFGIDSHIGIPSYSKVFFFLFIITFLKSRLYSRIRETDFRKGKDESSQILYRSAIRPAIIIFIFLFLKIFLVLSNSLSGHSTSQGTTFLFFLILMALAYYGMSNSIFLSFLQGKFIDLDKRIRVPYAAVFYVSIIFITLSSQIFYSVLPYSYTSIFYVLIPVSMLLFLSLGYQLRFKVREKDPTFLINASGPAAVMIILSITLSEEGNFHLISFTSFSSFIIDLLLLIPLFTLIIGLTSKFGMHTAATGGRKFLNGFSILIVIVTVIYSIYNFNFLNIGIQGIIFSLPYLIYYLLSLLILRQFILMGSIIILYVSTIYVFSKGLLSKIKNEVLNFLSAGLLSFLVILLFIFINGKVPLIGNVFIRDTLVFSNSLNINLISVLIFIVLLTFLLVVSYVISGFISPGTRKGGMMTGFIALFLTGYMILRDRNILNTNSLDFYMSLFSILILSLVASLIATPIRIDIMNEQSTVAYKRYEERMISRGTNQYGEEYLVDSQNFSTLNLVGPENSGKTTFLSFFLNFLDSITEQTNYTWDIREGIETMENLMHSIVVMGEFPEKSIKDKNNVISIEMKQKNGNMFSNLRIIDWPGKKLHGEGEYKRTQLSNGKAYAVFIDHSLYSNIPEYDANVARILQNILNNRKKGLPEPKFCFVLFNFPYSSIDLEGQNPKDAVMILPETRKIISSHLSSGTIFIRPIIKIKTTKSNEIKPETQEIEGILRIPFDPEINRAFKIFFGWLLTL